MWFRVWRIRLLNFLVFKKLCFIQKSVLLFFLVDAEFKNTGLERSEKLAIDLEWFKEQGYEIPEPTAPGKTYSQYLKDLAEKDPQAFICHFYNIYFAHSAGGRMIGRKVKKPLLYALGKIKIWDILLKLLQILTGSGENTRR